MKKKETSSIIDDLKDKIKDIPKDVFSDLSDSLQESLQDITKLDTEDLKKGTEDAFDNFRGIFKDMLKPEDQYSVEKEIEEEPVSENEEDNSTLVYTFCLAGIKKENIKIRRDGENLSIELVDLDKLNLSEDVLNKLDIRNIITYDIDKVSKIKGNTFSLDGFGKDNIMFKDCVLTITLFAKDKPSSEEINF